MTLPRSRRPVVPSLVAAFVLGAATGCGGRLGPLVEGTEPTPYPYDVEVLPSVPVEVFRRGSRIEVVNHTVTDHEDVELWVNERYVRRIPSFPAGTTLVLPLREFVDEYGEAFRGGGLLGTESPDPVVKAEIRTEAGLLGLLVQGEREVIAR